MAINVQRQQAFAAAFNQYPDILESFVERNVSLYDPLSETSRRYSSLSEKQMCMSLLMAQFITRLIQTRAKNSDSKLMTEFAEFTVQRYKNLTTKYIGTLVLQADDKYLRALNTVEQGMVNLIFEALMREAEIDEVAEENHDQNREFDEADFWHDVMLALGTYYRKNRHPRWWNVTQEMFMDHKAEFRKALEDENRLALEAEGTPNPASEEARSVGEPPVTRH